MRHRELTPGFPFDGGAEDANRRWTLRASIGAAGAR